MEELTPQEHVTLWMDKESSEGIREQLKALLKRFQKRNRDMGEREAELKAKVMDAERAENSPECGGERLPQRPPPEESASDTSWSWWSSSHLRQQSQNPLSMWDMVNIFSSYMRGNTSETPRSTRRPWTTPMNHSPNESERRTDDEYGSVLTERESSQDSGSEDADKILAAAEEDLRLKLHEIMMRPGSSDASDAQDDSDMCSKDMELLCEIQELARETSERRERLKALRRRLHELNSQTLRRAPARSAPSRRTPTQTSLSTRSCTCSDTYMLDKLIHDLKKVLVSLQDGDNDSNYSQDSDTVVKSASLVRNLVSLYENTVSPVSCDEDQNFSDIITNHSAAETRQNLTTVEKKPPGNSGDAEMATLAVLHSTRQELERLRGHLEYVCNHYEDARNEARNLRFELESVKSSIKCIRESSRKMVPPNKRNVAVTVNMVEAIDHLGNSSSCVQRAIAHKSEKTLLPSKICSSGGVHSVDSSWQTTINTEQTNESKTTKPKRRREGKKNDTREAKLHREKKKKSLRGAPGADDFPGKPAVAASASAAQCAPSAALAAQLASFLDERSAHNEVLVRALATALRDVPAGSPAAEAKARLVDTLALLAKTSRCEEEAQALARLLVRVTLMEPARVPSSPSGSAAAPPPSEPVVADSADVAAAVLLETFLGVSLREDLRARAFLRLLDILPPNFTTTMVRDASVKTLLEMARDEEEPFAAAELQRAAEEVQQKDPTRIGGAISRASPERIRREAQAVLLTVHRGRSLIEKFDKGSGCEERPSALLPAPVVTGSESRLSREVVQVAYLLRGVSMRDELLRVIFSEVMKQQAKTGRSMAEAKEQTVDVVARLASWQTDQALADEVAAVLVDVALKEPSDVERLMEQDSSAKGDLQQQSKQSNLEKASLSTNVEDNKSTSQHSEAKTDNHQPSEADRGMDEIESEYWPIGFVAIAGSDPPVIPFFRQGTIPSHDVVCLSQDVSKSADSLTEESHTEIQTETQTDSDGESYMSAEEEEIVQQEYVSNVGQGDVSHLAKILRESETEILPNTTELAKQIMHKIPSCIPQAREHEDYHSTDYFASDESCASHPHHLEWRRIVQMQQSFRTEESRKLTLEKTFLKLQEPLDDAGMSIGGGGGGTVQNEPQPVIVMGESRSHGGGIAPSGKGRCNDVKCKKRSRRPEDLPKETKCACSIPNTELTPQIQVSVPETSCPVTISTTDGTRVCAENACPVQNIHPQASQHLAAPSLTVAGSTGGLINYECPAADPNFKDNCSPETCPVQKLQAKQAGTPQVASQHSQQGGGLPQMGRVPPNLPECPATRSNFNDNCFPSTCPVMSVLPKDINTQSSTKPGSTAKMQDMPECPAGRSDFKDICKPDTCPVRLYEQSAAAQAPSHMSQATCYPAICNDQPGTICETDKCLNRGKGLEPSAAPSTGQPSLMVASHAPQSDIFHCNEQTCPNAKGIQTDPAKENRSTQSPYTENILTQTSLATQTQSEHQATVNYDTTECPASRADFQDVCGPATCPRVMQTPSAAQPGGGDMPITISTAPTCAPPQPSASSFASKTQVCSPDVCPAVTGERNEGCNLQDCAETATQTDLLSAQPPAALKAAPVGRQPNECDVCSANCSDDAFTQTPCGGPTAQKISQAAGEPAQAALEPCTPQTCTTYVGTKKSPMPSTTLSVAVQSPSTQNAGVQAQTCFPETCGNVAKVQVQTCSPETCDNVASVCNLPDCEISPSQTYGGRGVLSGTVTAQPSVVPGIKIAPVGNQPMECDVCSNILSCNAFTQTPGEPAASRLQLSPSTKPSRTGGGEIPITISTAPTSIPMQTDRSTHSGVVDQPCGPDICPGLQGMISTAPPPNLPSSGYIMESCATQTCPFAQGFAQGQVPSQHLSATGMPSSAMPPKQPSNMPCKQASITAPCSCQQMPANACPSSPPIEAPPEFRDASEREIQKQSYGAVSNTFNIPGLCGDSRCKGVKMAQEYFASVGNEVGPSILKSKSQTSKQGYQNTAPLGACQQGDCCCSEGCPQEWLKHVEPMQQRADDVKSLLHDIENKKNISTELQLLKDGGVSPCAPCQPNQPSENNINVPVLELSLGNKGHYMGYEHSNFYAESSVCVDTCANKGKTPSPPVIQLSAPGEAGPLPSKQSSHGGAATQDQCFIMKGEPCKRPELCTAPCPPRLEVGGLKSASAPLSSGGDAMSRQNPSGSKQRCAKCKIRLAAGSDHFAEKNTTLRCLFTQEEKYLYPSTLDQSGEVSLMSKKCVLSKMILMNYDGNDDRSIVEAYKLRLAGGSDRPRGSGKRCRCVKPNNASFEQRQGSAKKEVWMPMMTCADKAIVEELVPSTPMLLDQYWKIRLAAGSDNKPSSPEIRFRLTSVQPVCTECRPCECTAEQLEDQTCPCNKDEQRENITGYYKLHSNASCFLDITSILFENCSLCREDIDLRTGDVRSSRAREDRANSFDFQLVDVDPVVVAARRGMPDDSLRIVGSPLDEPRRPINTSQSHESFLRRLSMLFAAQADSAAVASIHEEESKVDYADSPHYNDFPSEGADWKTLFSFQRADSKITRETISRIMPPPNFQDKRDYLLEPDCGCPPEAITGPLRPCCAVDDECYRSPLAALLADAAACAYLRAPPAPCTCCAGDEHALERKHGDGDPLPVPPLAPPQESLPSPLMAPPTPPTPPFSWGYRGRVESAEPTPPDNALTCGCGGAATQHLRPSVVERETCFCKKERFAVWASNLEEIRGKRDSGNDQADSEMNDLSRWVVPPPPELGDLPPEPLPSTIPAPISSIAVSEADMVFASNLTENELQLTDIWLKRATITSPENDVLEKLNAISTKEDSFGLPPSVVLPPEPDRPHGDGTACMISACVDGRLAPSKCVDPLSCRSDCVRATVPVMFELADKPLPDLEIDLSIHTFVTNTANSSCSVSSGKTTSVDEGNWKSCTKYRELSTFTASSNKTYNPEEELKPVPKDINKSDSEQLLLPQNTDEGVYEELLVTDVPKQASQYDIDDTIAPPEEFWTQTHNLEINVPENDEQLSTNSVTINFCTLGVTPDNWKLKENTLSSIYDTSLYLKNTDRYARAEKFIEAFSNKGKQDTESFGFNLLNGVSRTSTSECKSSLCESPSTQTTFSSSNEEESVHKRIMEREKCAAVQTLTLINRATQVSRSLLTSNSADDCADLQESDIRYSQYLENSSNSNSKLEKSVMISENEPIHEENISLRSFECCETEVQTEIQISTKFKNSLPQNDFVFRKSDDSSSTSTDSIDVKRTASRYGNRSNSCYRSQRLNNVYKWDSKKSVTAQAEQELFHESNAHVLDCFGLGKDKLIHLGTCTSRKETVPYHNSCFSYGVPSITTETTNFLSDETGDNSKEKSEKNVVNKVEDCTQRTRYSERRRSQSPADKSMTDTVKLKTNISKFEYNSEKSQKKLHCITHLSEKAEKPLSALRSRNKSSLLVINKVTASDGEISENEDQPHRRNEITPNRAQESTQTKMNDSFSLEKHDMVDSFGNQGRLRSKWQEKCIDENSKQNREISILFVKSEEGFFENDTSAATSENLTHGKSDRYSSTENSPFFRKPFLGMHLKSEKMPCIAPESHEEINSADEKLTKNVVNSEKNERIFLYDFCPHADGNSKDSIQQYLDFPDEVDLDVKFPMNELTQLDAQLKSDKYENTTETANDMSIPAIYERANTTSCRTIDTCRESEKKYIFKDSFPGVHKNIDIQHHYRANIITPGKKVFQNVSKILEKFATNAPSVLSYGYWPVQFQKVIHGTRAAKQKIDDLITYVELFGLIQTHPYYYGYQSDYHALSTLDSIAKSSKNLLTSVGTLIADDLSLSLNFLENSLSFKSRDKNEQTQENSMLTRCPIERGVTFIPKETGTEIDSFNTYIRLKEYDNTYSEGENENLCFEINKKSHTDMSFNTSVQEEDSNTNDKATYVITSRVQLYSLDKQPHVNDLTGELIRGDTSSHIIENDNECSSKESISYYSASDILFKYTILDKHASAGQQVVVQVNGDDDRIISPERREIFTIDIAEDEVDQTTNSLEDITTDSEFVPEISDEDSSYSLPRKAVSGKTEFSMEMSRESSASNTCNVCQSHLKPLKTSAREVTKTTPPADSERNDEAMYSLSSSQSDAVERSAQFLGSKKSQLNKSDVPQIILSGNKKVISPTHYSSKEFTSNELRKNNLNESQIQSSTIGEASLSGTDDEDDDDDVSIEKKSIIYLSSTFVASAGEKESPGDPLEDNVCEKVHKSTLTVISSAVEGNVLVNANHTRADTLGLMTDVINPFIYRAENINISATKKKFMDEESMTTQETKVERSTSTHSSELNAHITSRKDANEIEHCPLTVVISKNKWDNHTVNHESPHLTTEIDNILTISRATNTNISDPDLRESKHSERKVAVHSLPSDSGNSPRKSGEGITTNSEDTALSTTHTQSKDDRAESTHLRSTNTHERNNEALRVLQSLREELSISIPFSLQNSKTYERTGSRVSSLHHTAGTQNGDVLHESAVDFVHNSDIDTELSIKNSPSFFDATDSLRSTAKLLSKTLKRLEEISQKSAERIWVEDASSDSKHLRKDDFSRCAQTPQHEGGDANESHIEDTDSVRQSQQAEHCNFRVKSLRSDAQRLRNKATRLKNDADRLQMDLERLEYGDEERQHREEEEERVTVEMQRRHDAAVAAVMESPLRDKRGASEKHCTELDAVTAQLRSDLHILKQRLARKSLELKEMHEQLGGPSTVMDGSLSTRVDNNNPHQPQQPVDCYHMLNSLLSLLGSINFPEEEASHVAVEHLPQPPPPPPPPPSLLLSEVNMQTENSAHLSLPMREENDVQESQEPSNSSFVPKTFEVTPLPIANERTSARTDELFQSSDLSKQRRITKKSKSQPNMNSWPQHSCLKVEYRKKSEQKRVKLNRYKQRHIKEDCLRTRTMDIGHFPVLGKNELEERTSPWEELTAHEKDYVIPGGIEWNPRRLSTVFEEESEDMGYGGEFMTTENQHSADAQRCPAEAAAGDTSAKCYPFSMTNISLSKKSRSLSKKPTSHKSLHVGNNFQIVKNRNEGSVFKKKSRNGCFTSKNSIQGLFCKNRGKLSSTIHNTGASGEMIPLRMCASAEFHHQRNSSDELVEYFKKNEHQELPSEWESNVMEKDVNYALVGEEEVKKTCSPNIDSNNKKSWLPQSCFKMISSLLSKYFTDPESEAKNNNSESTSPLTSLLLPSGTEYLQQQLRNEQRLHPHRRMHAAMANTSSSSDAEDRADCDAPPMAVELSEAELRPLDPQSLLLHWHAIKGAKGYEIYVNGELKQKVYSGSRDQAALLDLDLSKHLHVVVLPRMPSDCDLTQQLAYATYIPTSS